MNRLNLSIVKRFWAIAKLYWLGDEKKGALSLLAVLAVLLVGYTLLSVQLNTQQGEIFSALSKLDAARFWRSVWLYLAVLVGYIPVFAGFNYLQKKLALYWRRWLTYYFLSNYFGNRAFYNLSHAYTNIDNPDQRIAEDIRSFSEESLSFFLSLVNSFLQIIAFSIVLWKISQPLVAFLIIYSLLGTIFTVVVYGKKLIKLNFDQLKKEANFRFGLVRVRENAESIAFYRGENRENTQVKKNFQSVFDNFNVLILWEQVYLRIFTNTYQFLPYIIPALIIGPSILSGDLESGKLLEARGAFVEVFFSLNVIVSSFSSLSKFASGINRLYSFEEYLSQPQSVAQTNGHQLIETVNKQNLSIANLTLQTPNYQRTLIKNLSVSLQLGQGLLIMGASGCGKSSLLRAIAGLWNSGSGTITRPDLDEMLFLPQRPYMILGTLKEQLLYPKADLDLDDAEIEEVLKLVNLPDLTARFGGLDIEKDWGDVLSLGEQQRVAFARILLTKPAYAVLDEATSALDINNEESLYAHLKTTGTTYISVGHRPTLVKYHDLLLEILEDQVWELKPIKNL
jgi:putative ATP-binding cassette transporter